MATPEDTAGASHVLSEEAYLTILLHAAKYPSCTVCGVLLGTAADGGKGATISAAMPLFHLSMLLAPCVETALTQVEVLAAQRGLALLGYYHGEARMDAQDIHPIGKRIAERIVERQPGAFVVALNNTALAAFCRQGSTQPPFELLLRDGAAAAAGKPGWKKAQPGGGGGSALSVSGGGGWEALRARFLNLHAKGVHAQLADFDEHLDDVSRDYTNPQLFGADSGVLAR